MDDLPAAPLEVTLNDLGLGQQLLQIPLGPVLNADFEGVAAVTGGPELALGLEASQAPWAVERRHVGVSLAGGSAGTGTPVARQEFVYTRAPAAVRYTTASRQSASA
ncbi:hypothetical protein ACFWNR_18355, partial [Streptomyces virginiae]|uniref:hypothetical protein n=1 Tax=Streptomyces virginiae TaxID=1961 RepID=UPI00365998C6